MDESLLPNLKVRVDPTYNSLVLVSCQHVYERRSLSISASSYKNLDLSTVIEDIRVIERALYASEALSCMVSKPHLKKVTHGLVKISVILRERMAEIDTLKKTVEDLEFKLDFIGDLCKE